MRAPDDGKWSEERERELAGDMGLGVVGKTRQGHPTDRNNQTGLLKAVNPHLCLREKNNI